MNKTEILNIVNEPSKHIHIVKIDGKDSIVYSSKFVGLLELIPTMLTKADMVDMLTELQAEIEKVPKYHMTHNGICVYREAEEYISDINKVIQSKIDKLKKGESKNGNK